MYSRLSTSDAKKRYLNQEWQQVPRHEEDKKKYCVPIILQQKVYMIVRLGYFHGKM